MKIWGRSLVVCLGLVYLSAAHGQQYTIQTLAGNGSAGFAGDNGDPAASQLNSPHAVALDSKGDIYVGEVAYTNWKSSFPGTPMPNHLRSLQKLERVS